MATLLNKNNQNVGFIHSFFLCLNRFLSFDCFSLCFQVWWAAEHDESAQRIGVNARRFATRILGEEMVLYLMLPVCLCALTTTRSHVLFLVKTPLLFFYPFFKMYAILGFVLQSVLVCFFIFLQVHQYLLHVLKEVAALQTYKMSEAWASIHATLDRTNALPAAQKKFATMEEAKQGTAALHSMVKILKCCATHKRIMVRVVSHLALKYLGAEERWLFPISD